MNEIKNLTDSSEKSKRIAKNTIMLYLRMIFLMVISLYTSRVILNVLGVSDYGVYNVVGGIVTMFTILTSALNGTISRFLTFDLGFGDIKKLNITFCTSVNVQIILAIIIVILAEVAGVWFLNEKANIPEGRMNAANWVLQCSIVTFAVNLLNVPYNSTIIAHERMGVFAYFSILEAILKLVVVYLLTISSYDKLKTYAILILIIEIIMRVLYGLYCRIKFEECRYHLVLDKNLLKEMGSFAGWTFLGSSAGILNSQGVNIISNLFFGVKINAARGICDKVNSVVQQFVGNFMTAMNPQITKSYAVGDFEYMRKLAYRGARYSFYLLYFIALPISLEAEYILRLWLKIVPEYTVIFLRWTLASSLTLVVGNSILTALLASGKVKKYQIIISIFGILDFPITYIAYKMGFSPVSAYVIYFFVYFILIFVRYYLVKDIIHIDFKGYIIDVVLRVMIVAAISFIPAYLVYNSMEQSLLRLILVCLTSVFATTFVIAYIGIDKSERLFFYNKIKERFLKLKDK